MTVRCLFCQSPYRTPSGRSVCPNCQRAQQHTSMANFVLPVSPAGRVALLVGGVFVLLVLIGWAINLSG